MIFLFRIQFDTISCWRGPKYVCKWTCLRKYFSKTVPLSALSIKQNCIVNQTKTVILVSLTFLYNYRCYQGCGKSWLDILIQLQMLPSMWGKLTWQSYTITDVTKAVRKTDLTFLYNYRCYQGCEKNWLNILIQLQMLPRLWEKLTWHSNTITDVTKAVGTTDLKFLYNYRCYQGCGEKLTWHSNTITDVTKAVGKIDLTF